MSADFCTSIDCPLNQVTLDERSDGLELIIGFVSSSHQSGYVFTPSQISTISNEISCIIYKYNKTRDAMIARYGPNAAIHCPDFAIYNPQQQLVNKVQKPVIELENLNTNKITSPPPKSMNKTISAPNNLAPTFPKPNKLSEFVPKQQQQQQFPSPSAPPLSFADLETLEKIRQAPVEAKKNPPKQSTALADVALMTRIMKGIAVEKRPDQTTIDERIAAMNEAEARELAPEPVVELVPKRVPDIEPDSPHTRFHFRDIYEQTGFVGLKKKESLKKVSSVLNRPLGCCYDEVRKSWAIADSRNNRILLYPDGLSVESPKFINPASVCVIRPGQTLGILSDSCLCVYTYSNQQVAVVVEGTDGRKIGCRGLATTPLGNIVTIHRIDHAMFEAVIYDMFDPKKYGDIVSRISFTAGNPSFCHMNGNRLVISDLGNQTLMMFEYNHQETTAKLKKTVPFKWDHQGEPNGGFDFVSGVQVDVEGWSLVADAGGRTIQLFDQDLKFVCRVGCDFALPYTSAIAINQKREVMIIPRQQPAEVIVATLESFDRLPPILGLPGHSKRFVNHTQNTSFARFPGSANTSYQSPTTTSAHNSGRVFQSREFDDLPFGAKQP